VEKKKQRGLGKGRADGSDRGGEERKAGNSRWKKGTHKKIQEKTDKKTEGALPAEDREETKNIEKRGKKNSKLTHKNP